MSHLVAIAFKDRNTADKVLNEINAQRAFELRDIYVVFRDAKGRPHLKQSINPIAAGTQNRDESNSSCANLVRSLLGSPLTGWDFDRNAGPMDQIMSRATSECGIRDDFVAAIGQALSPNCSALFFAVENLNGDKTIRSILEYGGKLITTPLPAEQSAVSARRGVLSSR